MLYIVMGVCGSGKTTVGLSLAQKLKVPFRDADDFHSVENKAKMSKGIPLNDEDRFPWLIAIHNYLKQLQGIGKSGVVTCSALRKKYRDIILCGESVLNNSENKDVVAPSVVHGMFILLHGSKDVLHTRMKQRTGHFMPPSLLDSQLETLEIPDNSENAVIVNIDSTVEGILSDVLKKTSKSNI